MAGLNEEAPLDSIQYNYDRLYECGVSKTTENNVSVLGESNEPSGSEEP